LDARQQHFCDLLSAAWRAFEETYGDGRELTEELVEQAGISLEDHAAGLVVRDGEMALRKLLPEVPRDVIEDCLRQWLEEVYCGPDRGRYEQEAALEGDTLEKYFARNMMVKLLVRFGAFGPLPD
jgi:hypothetical protein